MSSPSTAPKAPAPPLTYLRKQRVGLNIAIIFLNALIFIIAGIGSTQGEDQTGFLGLLMIGIPNGIVLVWCCTDLGLLFTKNYKGIGHATTAWVLGLLALAIVVMTMACIGLRSTLDRADGQQSSLKYLAGDEYLWACFALSVLSWILQLLLLMYCNGQHKHRKAARNKSVEETSV